MNEGDMPNPLETARDAAGEFAKVQDALSGSEEAMTLNTDTYVAGAAGLSGAKAQATAIWQRTKAWARRTPVIAAATVFSLLSAFYWIAIATPRYVSEAHVIVQKTDLQSGAPTDLASVLTGGGIGNTADQLILRDYLLSRGMMERLDEELTLSDHWSQWWIDPLSKLTFANSPEDLYAYYLQRVTVEYDEYAGVLVIKSEGFDPQTAQAMTAAMVSDGEKFMNGLAQSLVEKQVFFLQGEVDTLAERAIDARQAVIAYQNQEGLVSPQIAAETITATISRLEARKTEMQIQLSSLSSYLVADHPSIVELQQQIEAVDEQIALENARLIGGGDQLNTQVEQFGRLQLEAEFATALHQTALAALERGRVESTRTIKSMSVVQPPTMPHEAGSPARLYNALVQAIFAFLIAGVIQLLIAIIREHKD